MAVIVLTVADHDKNGFISLARSQEMTETEARGVIAHFDSLVDAPHVKPCCRSKARLIQGGAGLHQWNGGTERDAVQVSHRPVGPKSLGLSLSRRRHRNLHDARRSHSICRRGGPSIFQGDASHLQRRTACRGKRPEWSDCLRGGRMSMIHPALYSGSDHF